jgi:hypothetical protein
LRRLDGFAERMGHDLHPALAELQRASESLAEVTDIAAAQARRVDRVVEEAVTRIERTTLVLQDIVVPSAGRLVAAAAAFRALRKGLQIFRRWRG